MNMKVLKKIFIVSMISLLLITICIPKAIFAVTPTDITGNVDGEDLNFDFVDKMVDLLTTIGIFIAVGAMMVIGIKYINGSVEEKATYKKTMMPYLIGCILIFSASALAPQIIELFKDASDAEKAGNLVLGIIQNVGTVVAVGALMIIGIKYILGSTEQRASYKKSLLPYVIGSILLFGAVNLTAFAYDILTIEDSGTGGTTNSSQGKIDANKYVNNHTSSEIREEYKKAQQELTNAEHRGDESGANYWREYMRILENNVDKKPQGGSTSSSGSQGGNTSSSGSQSGGTSGSQNDNLTDKQRGEKEGREAAKKYINSLNKMNDDDMLKKLKEKQDEIWKKFEKTDYEEEPYENAYLQAYYRELSDKRSQLRG